MTSFSISNKSRILEISAVILTAAGKFIFMDYLNWRFPFVAVAIISWVSYIIYRKSKQPGITKYWGFRTDNFKTVLKKVLPIGLLAVITFFGVGFYKGTLNISWHIIPILILYPIWGTIQQFLLIALTAGNLQDMKDQNLKKGIIILFAALLFGAIHHPYLWLMLATFILALFYGWIYLGDTYFPVIEKDDWTLVSNTDNPADEKHAYAFSFQLWQRKITNNY